MPDIFISYSRKDSEHALALAERLRSSGMEVWIDQRGIEAATSWSGEIADAIHATKAFVLLLSAASIASPNVKKELGVATEVGCSLVPIEIEKIELNRDFLYHLAGLQRVDISDFDGIMRALVKLGLTPKSPLPAERGDLNSNLNSPSPSRERGLGGEADLRKSLMILPFDDLSPTADNAWFADGIVSEMISALSNVKALRVTDAATTKDFKRYQGTLPNYAKEMQIRYFVSGDVRKFGDNIKITSRLLDIDTGDHLWQDSMKGTMDDIFDIQEKVAEKVVEGLKVHLASGEKKKLSERGTENAEAYELYMKADEYFSRQTKEGWQLAVQLFSEAIKLDPGYARAYSFKANALTGLYRLYDRTPALLDEAESLCNTALRLKPDLFAAYQPLAQLYMHRGELAKAEETAIEYVRKDPKNYSSHFTLGFFYSGTDQPAKAIAPFEEAVRLKPDYLPSLFNLVVTCDAAGESEKCAYWSQVALPHYERHLKLHPDDEHRRVHHVVLLLWSGNTEEAHAEAMKLTNLKSGSSLFNMASLLGKLGDPSEAIRTLRKAIDAGFRSIPNLKEFLTDEKDGVAALAGTPEYEEVKRMVDAIES